jgi:Putative zinc-finger
MSSNNGHNSSCAFEEQIVSYLYDEASKQEKIEFETHLKTCANCAGELSGFGFVRSSIQEWRNEEIFALEMPALEIPALKTATVERESSSWLENLKRVFSFSPKFAFGALAALVICAGLVVLALNFSGNRNIADSEVKQPEPILASNKINEEKIAAPKDEKVSDIAPAPLKQETADNKFVEKSLPTKKDSRVKAPNAAPKNKINAPKSNNFATNKNKKTDKLEKQEIPTLSDFDEDEDESLRLADLFSEIDTE